MSLDYIRRAWVWTSTGYLDSAHVKTIGDCHPEL